jgi:ribosomal protein S18 acetylase RimI-like enzyme
MNSPIAPLQAPELLSDGHELEAFNSGATSLDHWLKRRARGNQASGASRVYVVCRNNTVVGYYALAAGAVERDEAPSKVKRNMPSPVPAIVLGRLAVDRREQGNKIGAALLRDALSRAMNASHEIGAVAVLVHALNDRAKAFYLGHGFVVSPVEPLVLMLRIKDIAAALGEV